MLGRRATWLLSALVLLCWGRPGTAAPKVAAPECAKLRQAGALPEVTLIPVTFALPEDLVDSVAEILSYDEDGEPLGSVGVNERTNMLVVYDTPEVACRAKALVRSLDVPAPQVQLRMRAFTVPAPYDDDHIEWSETQSAPEESPFPDAEVRIGKWKSGNDSSPSQIGRTKGAYLCGQFHGVALDRRSMSMNGCLQQLVVARDAAANQPVAVPGFVLQATSFVQSESSTRVLIDDLLWYGQSLLSADPDAVLLNGAETLVISLSLGSPPKEKGEKSKVRPTEIVIVLSAEVIAPQKVD